MAMRFDFPASLSEAETIKVPQRSISGIGLVVGVSGEDLGLLGGDGSVSVDEDSHDTTNGPDTEGGRSNFEQE